LKNSLIIHLLIFILSFNSNSQNYLFQNFSTGSGLIQSQVNTICQDQNNYLWVGTLGGVSRFDGKEFLSFSKQDGLPDNDIIRLLSSNNNGIFGVTRDDFFIIKNEKVITQLNKVDLKDITDLILKKDTIIISTLKNGVYSFLLNKNEDLVLVNQLKLPIKTSVNRLANINDKLYICASSGLYVYDGVKLNKEFFIPEVVCTGIKTDTAGNLWVSTFKDGIYKVSKNKRTINLNESNSNIASNFIRDLYIDLYGNVWCTSKRSLTKISNQNDVFNYSDINGFNYVAETIFQDSEGNIWVGTEGKGIVRFVSDEFTYLSSKQGLNSDLMLSFCEDEDENIWFSSYGDGVAVKNKLGFEHFTSFNSGLANNTVWCSLKDSEEKLWFGTANGLSIYANGFLKNLNEKDGLPSKKVQSLYQDKNNILWIGTREGVIKYKEGSLLTNETIRLKNVRFIYEDVNSKIWFASSQGLFYKTKNKQINQLKDSLLEDLTIYNVDGYKNIIWIGTSSGLYKIINKKVTKIDLSKFEKGTETINFIKKDNENHLWVGTNNGVYTINLINEKITKHKVSDGLIGAETNLNAVFQDSKGKMWIGTSEGVSIFKRNDYKLKTHYNPIIDITNVKLFYETKNYIEDSLKKEFKFNRNHFTFYFKTPYFSSPENVNYTFILEGFDKDWSPLENVNFARYSNIPHGNYTFKVKSTINGYLWSNIDTYSFAINKPFWLNWWFRILTLIVAFSSIYLLYKRLQNGVKEKQEKELLTYKNKLIKLEQQSLNASLNRHFIFNALNSIQFYINKEDKLSANRYLSSFAKLIRKNLDSSSNEDNLLPLSEEIERLTLYLSLEKMRFKDKFEYQIDIDKSINQEETKVPGMFLQPFIENSIWHGVLPKEKEGLISLVVTKKNNEIHFLIKDNGIGISQSVKNKKGEPIGHTSKGMMIATNRISLLEKISGKKILIEGPKDIIEEGEIKGTVVEIIFY
jgi:ligand-binding sensor domain-containing protein